MSPPDTRRDVPYRRGETALLLVDMQRVWVIPGADPAHPERGPDDPYYRQLREVVVPNQVRLVAAARAAGVEVVHTIIESLTADGRDRSLDHKLSSIHLPRGALEAQVIAELTPGPDEIVLPKTSSGVFNSTNIEYLLRNIGIDTLVVTGFLTDQCVDHTLRDAADRGFYPVCVSDACATHSAPRHENALNAFKGYCRTLTTVQLVAAIKESAR